MCNSAFLSGEVFVLDDGSEVDPCMGWYERFLDIRLTGDNFITADKIDRSVNDVERKRDYPHGEK